MWQVGALVDDLGATVVLPKPPLRIVSLVPSITEALATTVPERLVGATDWCTHPEDLEVGRVRGTKNPDLAAIQALSPDLVFANHEENRELDVRLLLERGIPIWVTVTHSVPQALQSLDRLLTDGLGTGTPEWLTSARDVWAAPSPTRGTAAVAVWRDPWMVVGRDTFTGDVLGRLGFANVYGDHAERYPHVTVEDIVGRRPDLVLLPDEPYAFTVDDGPDAFASVPPVLVSGRLLTWYGPSLVEARYALEKALAPYPR